MKVLVRMVKPDGICYFLMHYKLVLGKLFFVIRKKNMETVFLEVFNEKKLLQHIPYELVFQELDDLPHNFQKNQKTALNPGEQLTPFGHAEKQFNRLLRLSMEMIFMDARLIKIWPTFLHSILMRACML